MKQEVAKKNTRWSSTIWVIYICLVVLIGTMGFLRLVGLLRRVLWREDLGDNFPSACGDWSEAHGCTRVTLLNSGCERVEDISGSNSIIFATSLDTLLNSELSDCIE